jgi:anti-sigma factor RsiW
VTFVDCPREQDVIDALTTGQWPDRCAGELKAHVAACDGCRDLVAILAPLGESWAGARIDAHVPASGMVWWRAQMRARQEAARAAARPITVVQGIAGLAGAALVIACFVFASPVLESSLASSRAFLAVGVPDLGTLASGWVLAAGAALLLVSSLAVYLVVAED